MLQAAATPTTTVLTVADIDTTVNCEPRVLDTVLAGHLGMAQARNIRPVIEGAVDELSAYGEVCTRPVQTSAKGGRPGKAYYLTEGQALCICALSRAPNAASVRRALIEAFMELRRQKLEAQMPARARPRLPAKPRLRAFFARGLRAFPVRGDNMEPTFRRGDFALVQPVETYEGEGVYVVGLEHQGLYRAMSSGKGMVALWSDNTRYSRDEVTLAWFQANVVAKAVFTVNCIDRRLIPDALRH